MPRLQAFAASDDLIRHEGKVCLPVAGIVGTLAVLLLVGIAKPATHVELGQTKRLTTITNRSRVEAALLVDSLKENVPIDTLLVSEPVYLGDDLFAGWLGHCLSHMIDGMTLPSHTSSTIPTMPAAMIHTTG